MNLCVSCGLDFGSVGAFDAHRVGVHEYTYQEGLRMEPMREDGRRCLSEDEIAATVDKRGTPLFARNAQGRWSIARDLERAPGLRPNPVGAL